MFEDMICSYSVLPHEDRWHVFVDDDATPTASFATKDEAVAWCRNRIHERRPVPEDDESEG